MQLPLQNFAALMAVQAASVQGAAATIVDLAVGSVLRAILQANAALVLWLQWLIVQVLGTTRAATSTGADLDSFTADFGLARVPAQAAVGQITLARATPTLAAFIPVGAQIRTAATGAPATLFAIAAAPALPGWSASPAGYTLGAGVAAITLPAIASAPGAAGNIQAGTATVLGTPLAGIDTATNQQPFTGGLDSEPDAALRLRFANYIQSRPRGTRLAIATAIDSTRVGLTYQIAENADTTGAYVPGSIVVTLDDGTGSPSAALLAAVYAAIDAVRPIGSVVTLRAPAVIYANVAVTLAVADETQRPVATAAVAAAWNAWIAALPVGAPLPITRLAQIAYDASPLIVNLAGLVINGVAGDLVAGPIGVIKPGALAVS